MRAFIAVILPQEIKDSLAALQNKLKNSRADVKWVAPKNIHLTLKFLGERDDKKIAKIMQVLEEAAKDKTSFQARISSLGAFPKTDFPRVIWVGLDKGDNETKAIAQELEEKIAKVGIPKETRPFSCHITIGRLRSTLNREELVRDLKVLMQEFNRQNLEFQVNKIVLFKSTLTPQGPIYEPIKEADLKTA